MSAKSDESCPCDLAIVLPATESQAQLHTLLKQLPAACAQLPAGTQWETIICAPRCDAPIELLQAVNGRIAEQTAGYGNALKCAVATTRARYILTMEAGIAHHPFVIPFLYSMREQADLVIASRFVPTGYAFTSNPPVIQSKA